MRTKFYIVLTLSVLLVAFAIYGIATSIGSCREWTAFSLDTNVPPRVLYYTQKLLFIAYNWMAVALIAIITSAALIIWYVMRQIKLYPELRIFLTNSPELEYKKLKVDTYGNNVTYGRSTLKSRRQVTLLLDYLIKRENHTIHYLQLNDIYQTNFYDGSPGARRKVFGSQIGGIKETQEMLDYSVANNIYPEVEIIKADGAEIDKAYQNVLDGKVKFRYVIDMKTMK